MIVGIFAFIAGIACMIYAVVQHLKAKKAIANNALNEQYNLWSLFGLIGWAVFMIISAMAFRGVVQENTRIDEVDQCGKAEAIWPGQTLMTDHCYIEVKKGSGIYMRNGGMDSTFYSKQEVLNKETP